MFSEPAVFVDIETNGKLGHEGRIIEIGVLRVEDGEITETFHSLVNPGGRVPFWIERLTGISNNDLVSAPYFDDIAESLRRLMNDAIFVAHNVRFDYAFLKSHFKAMGHDYRPKLFCTVRMSRALYPEHQGHSLEKIIKRHAIPTPNRHRAFEDAKATYDFTRLAISEKGAEAFAANIKLQLRTKSLPPHVDENKITALPAGPGIYIFNDESGLPLYVGKSVNIQDRVRSHFTNDTRIVKEMKLSQRSYSIDFIETDTEIEALLLESAKVKELQPLLNRKLRRTTKQSVLIKRYDGQGYLSISVESKDLNEMTDTENIYGVYTSRSQAKTVIENLTKTFQLCPKLMSLEKAKSECFRHQLGACKGACVQEESSELYNRRVELALSHSKIESWPFKSKIAVRISETKSLIVDQWIIEGILHYDFEPVIERIGNGFDIDTYKILRSFIRTHKHSVSVLDPARSF
jgi:DNA polymerase-3 subunit epsilon